jgi:hypothetical protein
MPTCAVPTNTREAAVLIALYHLWVLYSIIAADSETDIPLSSASDLRFLMKHCQTDTLW